MKNFSLPRFAFLLWFLNYTLFALLKYAMGGGRLEIFSYVVMASVWTVVELICLGWIEEKF